MVFTRRGSLRKEVGKKEFDTSNVVNTKRNSTGSTATTANAKYIHKISTTHTPKISRNMRPESFGDGKSTFGVRKLYRTIKFACKANLIIIPHTNRDIV